MESDTFLMPLIPRSDRKTQLVKETIKRHSHHGADGGERAGGEGGVTERVSQGETSVTRLSYPEHCIYQFQGSPPTVISR